MQKHSVNLLIKKSSERPEIARARIYLPIFAAISLVLFVIAYLASILYLVNNNQKYNSLISQIDNLERQIAAEKTTEGVYSLTIMRVNALKDSGSGSKNYIKLLTELSKLKTEGISISQTAVDKSNAVSLAVTASSSASLDNFVNALISADRAKLYSEIKSSGIVRDKNGSYLLTVLLKPDNSLLQ